MLLCTREAIVARKHGRPSCQANEEEGTSHRDERRRIVAAQDNL